MVCEKHQNFLKVTGEPILKREGFLLSHFPVLDGTPANKGHLLIESIRHIVDPADLNDEEAQGLGLLIRDAIVLVRRHLEAEQAYVFRLNEKVAHFHVHIVPRYKETPTEYMGYKIMDWADFPKLDLAEVKHLSRKLAVSLT